MKRVIAESEPRLPGGDPAQFARALLFDKRSVKEELDVIAAVRRQMTTILRSILDADFQRTSIHSRDGALTLETLLKRISSTEKRRALGL